MSEVSEADLAEWERLAKCEFVGIHLRPSEGQKAAKKTLTLIAALRVSRHRVGELEAENERLQDEIQEHECE